MHLVSMLRSSSAVSAMAVGSSYVSETCQVERRGILQSVDVLSSGTGGSICYILNLIMPWKRAALVMAGLCVSGLLQSFILPETKYWYMLKKNEKMAEESLLWFQPHLSQKDIDMQIRLMRESIEQDSKMTNKVSLMKFIKSLSHMRYLKPVLLGSFLFLLRSSCGRCVIVSYTVDVFEDLKTPYNAEFLAAGLGVIESAGCCCVLLLVPYVKRKTLFHLVSIIMAISLSVTIAYQFYVEYSGASPIPWLPVVGVYGYGMIVAGGYMSSITVISSEIQYPYFRAPAMTFFTFLIVSTVLIYTTIFPYVQETIPIHYIFMYFVIAIMVGNVVVWLAVPETSNKQFYEN